ncbi:MAG: 4-(cytidine 5'-diphospho)-2-C-methyl-D-erythritol kinase [Deltaproteobacteria bacterium]|nr:4-(cytidine 5'-diphospho)-2-C-methyl-D-erythritol kinase [Deltaproteobacteria bacterium]
METDYVMETSSSPTPPSKGRQSKIIHHPPSTHFAPAKLNVRLKVTARRPDGYHELVSIMVPIGLYDRLDLQITPGPGVEISCNGFSAPANQENLACQAAMAFFGHTGMDDGLSIRLTKNIPVAAGLGGGSSDAACVLKALNEAWSCPLTATELAELAVGLGADVPFFLTARPCIARGIGEILEPIEKWPKLWYIVITPPIQVSTSWVYGNLNVSAADGFRELKLTNEAYQAIITNLKKKPFAIGRFLDNDLEKITIAHFPAIEHIKKSLAKAGADGVLMTGSGPSVFGIFESREAALQAKTRLVGSNLGDIFLAQGLL